MIVLGIIAILILGIILDNYQFNAPKSYNNRNQDEIKEYFYDSLIDDEPCKVRINLSLQGRAVAKYKEYIYNRSNQKELKYSK
jgi:hypothetical protein